MGYSTSPIDTDNAEIELPLGEGMQAAAMF